MPLVVEAAALAGSAKRLAGAGAGPDPPCVGPSGGSKGGAPDADSSEEK